MIVMMVLNIYKASSVIKGVNNCARMGGWGKRKSFRRRIRDSEYEKTPLAKRPASARWLRTGKNPPIFQNYNYRRAEFLPRTRCGAVAPHTPLLPA